MTKSLLSYPTHLAPGLFARMAASLLNHVSTYTPSIFLALWANSSRREVFGI
jgi:phosphotransferase system HPr-like phosphotransfer protein